jgi:hypothetical protein
MAPGSHWANGHVSQAKLEAKILPIVAANGKGAIGDPGGGWTRPDAAPYHSIDRSAGNRQQINTESGPTDLGPVLLLNSSAKIKRTASHRVKLLKKQQVARPKWVSLWRLGSRHKPLRPAAIQHSPVRPFPSGITIPSIVQISLALLDLPTYLEMLKAPRPGRPR